VAYSNSFNFGSQLLISDLIIYAFERIGISAPEVLGIHNQSAISSLNFLFSDWANKGFNLFTIQKSMFQINVGQPSYILPTSTIETPEVTASNNRRLLGGTPFSSAGGVASNAFSGTTGVACTQTSPNGYISYIYPPNSSQPVFYAGIQSNITTDYTIVCEYSYDNVSWINNISTPKTYYPIGQIIWWVLNTPIDVQAIRIRETGGSTLDIQQIYFSSPIFSTYLTPISRSEYITYPNKLQIANPSSFYLDRQLTPTMTLWPTPNNSYQTIVYNRKVQIMDVTSINQNINIPQRFLKATLMGLAAEMALIYKPEKFTAMKMLADEAYQTAKIEDTEYVPLRITPNIYPA
jgi:hypothetical protein